MKLLRLLSFSKCGLLINNNRAFNNATSKRAGSLAGASRPEESESR